LERPYKKRTKSFFWNISLLVILICLILFFAKEYFFALALISAILLLYVYSSVPPQMTNYYITNYGIRSGEQIYYWQECKNFWLIQQDNFRLINVDINRIPFRLILVLDERLGDDEMKELFSYFMPEFKPPDTTSDKVISWWKKTFPFDFDNQVKK